MKYLRRFIIGLSMLALTYFLIDQIRFENQLSDLQRFCSQLKLQSPFNEVESLIQAEAGLSLVMLDSDPEGVQRGGVYFNGAGGWVCSVSFLKGRLTEKRFTTDSSSRGTLMKRDTPSEKIKPW